MIKIDIAVQNYNQNTSWCTRNQVYEKCVIYLLGNVYKYTYIKHTSISMKVMPPIFYEKRMIIKFTYIMGWNFFLPTKSSLATHFSTFSWNAMCRVRVTLLKCQSYSHMLYFSSSSSTRRVLRVHLSRNQRDGSQRV